MVEIGISTETQRVTISLGIASDIPLMDKHPQQLIGPADQALYQAKNPGHNCWVSYEELTQE